MTCAARPGSPADPTRRHPRGRFSTLALGVVLVGCATYAGDSRGAEQAAEPVTFQTYEVITGSAERRTVLTGFLLGGAMAELAVVHVDEYDDRRLRIYAFGDGAWVPRLDATLGPRVAWVDVANIGGRDRLVTYERGRLNWFDPESSIERALVSVTSTFDPPPRGDIPHVDVTRDVNDDDRDDLVVPDVDGFCVFIQMRDGTFADPVKIGPPTEMGRIYGADGYRYDPWSQSRVHEVDHDGDGRGDLVFWNEDHFEVHTQGDRGLFAPVGATITTEVAFDSDQISSLATGDMRGRVLHSLTDLNGDGVAELVVASLQGESISSKRTSYEVHAGTPAPAGGTVWAPDSDIAFQSDDSIQLGMDRHDFDRDGQVDLMFTAIGVRFLERSLWKSIKGFMGDDIWLDLEFYRLDGGRYPDAPSAARRIALDGAPSHREPGWVPLDIVLRGGTHASRQADGRWPRAFNRTLLIGDVTGDGRSDLLIGTDGALDVFVGVPGPDLFAGRAHKVAVAVPSDEEYAWLLDLNRDGKQDILLHHPACCVPMHRDHAPPQEPRVTLLIAR